MRGRLRLAGACCELLDLAVDAARGLRTRPRSAIIARMPSRRASPRRHDGRQRLAHIIGQAIARFQEATYAFDDVAAEILALHRTDLPVMTALLFQGPGSADELAATLRAQRSAVTATLERLQLAGYARRQPGEGARLELTAHARTWVERIWAPLQHEGARLLDAYSLSHLRTLADFTGQASALQEARTTRLRAWLALPASPARRPHLRGGLSPAALQRVQVFVEASLGEAIPLHDLAARAGLSPYHFARAFKTSVGMTPRAFVEHRRIERAKQLLAESTHAIAGIAIDTGFGTQSRFTSVFKRQTGFTPAVYRRGRA
jgi:AraC family transcriptional regulator